MLRATACILLFAMLFLASTPVSAQASARQSAVEQQDVRLARISEQLLGANVHLCNEVMPLTGIILHSFDQYSADHAGGRFANGRVGIAEVLAHSPAARAGLHRDDGLLAIGGQPLAGLFAPSEGNLREAAFDVLASQNATQPVSLRINRNGVESTVMLSAPAGCRTLVEILVRDGPHARSDGSVIQVQFDFARELTDEQLAVVLAHELAHTVLEHRRRKEEAEIDNGLLAGAASNRRANREAEVEADRLSVHLLANAGYDPLAIPRFWRSEIGRRLGGGIFNSYVYPSNEARAVLVEQEIELYLPQRRGPTWPGHLLEMRERAFSRD